MIVNRETILWTLSCNLSNLLLVYWLWNIQTIEQCLIWDSTKALKTVFLFSKESNFGILERVITFWLAFLQNFRARLSNFGSTSIVIKWNLRRNFQFNLLMFITQNYQSVFFYVAFHVTVFKLTYSKHEAFFKWF